MLEAISWKKTPTSKGDAILLSVIETTTFQKKEQRVTSTVMIPIRFEPQCERIPCLLYYAGKRQSKKGQDYHDLKFIRADDKEVFHNSDDGLDLNKDKASSIQSPPPPPPPTPSTSANNIYCTLCDSEGLVCSGFCANCGEHQPKDGLHCSCSSH